MRHICSMDGCESFVKGFGFCSKHYKRYKKTGSAASKVGSHGPILDRFWIAIQKGADEDCWEWLGTLVSGYGRLPLGGRGAGFVLAHRFSCQLHHGNPPYEGAHVMHKCDNRACVNPSHLKWCTPSENIQDAYNKGRKVSPFKKGAAHHNATLDDEKVRLIRQNPNIKISQFARLLGVSVSNISAIRRGETWKHVTVP